MNGKPVSKKDDMAMSVARKNVGMAVCLLLAAASLSWVIYFYRNSEQTHKGFEDAKQKVLSLETQIQNLERILQEQRTRIESLQTAHDRTGKSATADGDQNPNLRIDLNDPNQEDRRSQVLKAILQDAVVQIVKKNTGETETEELDLLKAENAKLKLEIEQLRSSLTPNLQVKEATALAAAQNDPAAEWNTQKTPVQKVSYLQSLSQLSSQRDPQIIPILEQALLDLDPQVCLAASELLGEYLSPEILPAIEKALASPNEKVRLNAMDSLANIDDPAAATLMGLALNDVSESVRTKSLEAIKQQEGDRQLASLSAAMASQYNDVKTEALSLLELRGDHKAVPVIMGGLLDANPEYRQEVNSALNFLIEQEFETYEQAIKWWENNNNRFDENLFEK